MKYILYALAIQLVSSLNSVEDPKQDGKKDQELIQGTWKVVSSQKNGKPHEDTKDARFVFKEDVLTIHLVGEDPQPGGRFVLDPSKNPKWIDGDLGKGIYLLEGNTLKICTAEERPKQFISKENVYLYVL